MAQIAKMESQVDIKSSAERFFQTYCNKQTLFPKMSPNVVKNMQLVKGSDSKLSVGSVMKWTYAPTGNSPPQVATVIVEAIDEKNNSITSRVIEGDTNILDGNYYKFTLQTTNAPQGSGAAAKTTLEYEKLNPNAPDPATYFDVAAVFYKSIDAYLVNNP